MKKLPVSFDQIHDSTGHLFSLAKCLYASMKCSPYAEAAEDVIAASGFAFRMWADEKELCPSAASIWTFAQQKAWVENAGLTCGYVERLWHESAMEEERRNAALQLIARSVEAGFAPVVWDLGGAEWGLITGCECDQLLAMKTNGQEYWLPCERLGRLDIPILSVLTVTGKKTKTAAQLTTDTKKLAAAHLRGEEWCGNAGGLAAYDAIIGFVRERMCEQTEENLVYMLGTYAALKWYAWKFFDKYSQTELAGMYKVIHTCWQQAFEMRGNREMVIGLLRQARDAETMALALMDP